MPTLTDLLSTDQPQKGTLADLTAPSGIRPAVNKEPGYIDTALTGVVQGGMGLVSGAGAASEWAGDVLDSPGMRNVGKSLQGAAQKVLDSPVGQLEGKSFEGTFMENPNAKKVTQIVAQAVPSLAAALATGGGTALGMRALGASAPTAMSTGSAVAAGGLGLVEGAPQYLEAKKAGKSTGQASAIGAAATLGTAALEYLGLGSIMKGAGKGILKGAAKSIITEGAQEGTQQLWQNLVAKVGYDDTRSLLEGMAEAIIGGAGAGGLAGGVTGGMEARSSRQRDAVAEATLKNIIKDADSVTVADGMATVVRAGGKSRITAPVAVAAKAFAAGVTPDELTAATSEIERGVEAVKKKRSISRVADDPTLPNAVLFNVKGKEYAYAPKEGMTRADLEAGLEGKSPGLAFNWLKKNAVQVPLGETNVQKEKAPAQQPAVMGNEPVQVVQPRPEQVVGSVPEQLTTLNEEINNAVNIPMQAGTSNVTAAVTRDAGEAVAAGTAGAVSTDRKNVNAVGTSPEGAQNETAQASQARLLEPVVSRPLETSPVVANETPVGETQTPAAQAAPAVSPDLSYDGEGIGLHSYTFQSGPAKGASFSVAAEGFSPEKVQAEHDKVMMRFTQATPSASTAPIASAPQGVTPAKTKSPKIPKVYVKLAKDIDTVIKEDGVSDDFKRVPSFEAIAAYRKKFPTDAPDVVMSELAWMPEDEYRALTIEDSVTDFAKTGLSATDPPLPESFAVQRGVEGKTSTEAAQFLIDTAPDEGYRLVAEKVQVALQRLEAAGMPVTINVAHVGTDAPANLSVARGLASTFFKENPRVDVWLNGADVTGKVGVSYEVVLHELVHAATQGAILIGKRTKGKTELSKNAADLLAITDRIIRHANNRIRAYKAGTAKLTDFEMRLYKANGMNALANENEVLAWAMSNKDMQTYLESIKIWKTETLWSRFVSSVRNFLGLEASADSALSEVLRVGENLLDTDTTQLMNTLNALNGRAPTQRQTTAYQITDTFSLADNTLKAGQKKLNTAVRALSNPKSKLHDLYVQYAPQWLSVTPLHTLVQTFGKTIPQIKQFAKHLDAVVASKTEIVDTSAVLYDQAEKIAKEGVGIEVLNTAAATASFNRMTPWESIYDQAWVPETGTNSERLKAAQKAWVAARMQKSTGLTYTQAYNEAKQAYADLKTEDLKQAYIKVVEHIASVRVRERNNLLQYIESVSEKGSELRANLMAQFEASFSNLHGAYWPLARVGDFRLEYTDTEGFRTVRHFTTIAERREAVAGILEEGVDPGTIKEDFKDKQPRGSVAIPQMLMGQLAEAVEKKALAGVDPNNADAVELAQQRAQEITDDMNQIWLRWQPETSALKNSVRRKNVKGYNTDMLRSYLDYMQRHASNIAWTEQGKKIEMDIKTLADNINEAKQEDGMVDVTMQRHILNDLRNRIQALRSVSVGPVASVLGKLGTAYYMTSPSIALVQMSQLGVLTLPKLSTMFGAGKAAAALGRGTRDAFKKAYTREPMFADPVVDTVYRNMREVVTDENRAMPQAAGKELGDRLYTDDQILNQMKGFTPYQKQLLVLREAMARNLLDISAAHEAYELTRGKDPKSLTNRAFKFAMLPMSLSELASRKATVLATFDLAQQKGQDFFQSMNTIGEVVNDTLYSYSKENKGSAMQGGVSRVILQFQHYRIMTGVRLALLFKNAVKGETAEVKTAAAKELVGIMGMSAALAGTLGLPMSSLIFSILNLVLGDDDEPIDSELIYTNWLKENLGETLGDVAASGLPTLAGADLSGRIGLSGIYGIQNEPPSGLHGRNLAAWWAASQLGPIFSVGQGWFQGYDEIVNKGNYLKGLEASTPKPIKDALKAYRIASDGLKTGQGKRLLADNMIGPDELILVALGFNADEIAKAQTAERSLQKISTRISERRGKLIRQAAKAFMDGDDASEALENIRKFNRSMPAFSISGGDIRPAIRKILVGDIGTTGPRESMVARQYEIPDYVRE